MAAPGRSATVDWDRLADGRFVTLCCQSSFQARRREADIGIRANARFLDIGFVPEADARHPTLSPEKFIAQFVLFYGK